MPEITNTATNDLGPFGAENRKRLLGQYFSSGAQLTPADAWKHVYRLLLWIDRTTGLAHCYESDKSQPGKPWYPRSLAFHAWVSQQLGTSPADLAENIDWLFRQVIQDLAAQVTGATISEKGEQQRLPFEGQGFPEPGEDPEFREVVLATLESYLHSTPPSGVLHVLADRVKTYLATENKRNNLTGEGFEDALAAVLARIPAINAKYEVRARSILHDIPGFAPPPQGSKVRKVDLALVHKSNQRRILITAKWSVRSDREEQFKTDFDDYVRFNSSASQNFDYVLVTNEFDPARLVRACDKQSGNHWLFTDVVHVNPQGPLSVYAAYPGRGAQREVPVRVHQGRLNSLEGWLSRLTEL